MNQHLFNPNLKGTKLSNTLSLLATIEFALGIFFGVLLFLVFFIVGIILATENSIGGFFLMFLGGIIGGFGVFFASFVFSVVLKGFAAIVLHTYIDALNNEKITDSAPKPTTW